MQISPQRRRRIVRAHYLRQSGRSLSQSAEILDVSRATVHADLKLIETHWDILAELTHDDLLLDQIEQLSLRLKHLLGLGPLDLIEQLGLPKDSQVDISQMTRLYAVHQQSIQAAAREFRLLLRELKPETRQRAGEIIDIELAGDPQSDWTELNKAEHPEHLIPYRTREIAHSAPTRDNSAEHLNTPVPRNTGRNQPCPCGSGKKRKRCHPQSLAPPQRAGAGPHPLSS